VPRAAGSRYLFCPDQLGHPWSWAEEGLVIAAGQPEDNRSRSVRTAVMYAGRMAEAGPTSIVLRQPSHPYVTGLHRALPDAAAGHRLTGIPGQAPEPLVRVNSSARSEPGRR
jgi:ABC-type glutathione transport system ATPase component